MSRIFTRSTRPYEDCRLYRSKKVTVNPGLTILTGCNGSGKTTMLNHIKHELKVNNIPVFQYDNVHDGGSHAVSLAGFLGKMQTAATLLCSSEGEQINYNIGQVAQQLGAFVRQHSNEKELWVLLDAVDSGYSIDNIIETKQDLFDVVIEDCRRKNIDIYIVVSANSYEMASGEQCLDVWSGEYITFESYMEYKLYILRSRARKDKRYTSK